MRKIYALLILSFFIIKFSSAQPGSNDPGFNPVDLGDGASAAVKTIALQNDGKLLLGGRFHLL